MERWIILQHIGRTENSVNTPHIEEGFFFLIATQIQHKNALNDESGILHTLGVYYSLVKCKGFKIWCSQGENNNILDGNRPRNWSKSNPQSAFSAVLLFGPLKL